MADLKLGAAYPLQISLGYTPVLKIYQGSVLVWPRVVPEYSGSFGKFYNGFAVNDTRCLANTGWHVPAGNEMRVEAGGLCKQMGITHWLSPNSGATKSNGFSLLAGGCRNVSGIFSEMLSIGYWWTSDHTYNRGAVEILSYESDIWWGVSNYEFQYGFSVILFKDDPNSWLPGDTYTGNDGQVYQTMKIGNKVFLRQNLKETKYRNGDTIPEVTDNSAWAGLQSGAWCYYGNNASFNASTDPVYVNSQVYADFQKNNCGQGYVGSTVRYTVPLAKFVSLISQADANAQAQADINANGQAYANANGSCIPDTVYWNVEINQEIQKNDCGSGYHGSYVSCYVAANTYSSNYSQQDADNQAWNVAQEYANTYGTCIEDEAEVYTPNMDIVAEPYPAYATALNGDASGNYEYGYYYDGTTTAHVYAEFFDPYNNYLFTEELGYNVPENGGASYYGTFAHGPYTQYYIIVIRIIVNQ